MTENKRFSRLSSYLGMYTVFDDREGKPLSAKEVIDLLNELNTLSDENEQLKKELEENKELIQFKEQVFNLINKKLEENERELNGVDTAMYYANKGTLNELKKELYR